jgi:hypothetical protein
MKLAQVALPSNKRFGFFFTVVFAVAAGYFYSNGFFTWTYIFAQAAATFLGITFVKADFLLPLNKLWMRFGLLLGMFVSPIVLGVIFFGLFMPIAFLMKISGRDELSLKIKKKNTYWRSRNHEITEYSFKNQF